MLYNLECGEGLNKCVREKIRENAGGDEVRRYHLGVGKFAKGVDTRVTSASSPPADYSAIYHLLDDDECLHPDRLTTTLRPISPPYGPGTAGKGEGEHQTSTFLLAR